MTAHTNDAEHSDALIEAARPPLATDSTVPSWAFYGHAGRSEWAGPEPTRLGAWVDRGGREWSLVFIPDTGELVADNGVTVTGLAVLDADAGELSTVAAAAVYDREATWEEVLSRVRSRRELNLGRVHRLTVTVEVTLRGAPTPDAVLRHVERALGGAGVGASVVSWADRRPPAPVAPSWAGDAGFVDTVGRRYVGSVDGRRALVVEVDGAESEYRFEAGSWRPVAGEELGPAVERNSGLASLLTRASMLARAAR